LYIVHHFGKDYQTIPHDTCTFALTVMFPTGTVVLAADAA